MTHQVYMMAQDGSLIPASQEAQQQAMQAQEAVTKQEEEEQVVAEEYVLPADESEWTKLFEVLRLRLAGHELTPREKEEGEALLTYQTVISLLPLTEQVSIFQQLCLLTNTAIEAAD